MKLLFTDSAQLNEYLGFVDADIDYDKIKSELYTATKELIALIGKEAYKYALALQVKEAAEGDAAITEAETFQLFNFRYPIAVDAYRQYVPSNDLSHTNNGRKMRNGEHEKAAFEWMVNRDNDALEKRYYKAVDNLLDLLDEENPVFKLEAGETPEVKWKNSEAFKKTHRLFVRTTSDFDEYFPINSRLLLLKLQPGLSQCERLEILPRIGKIKFDAQKSLLEGSTTNGALDEPLLALIKEACVFFALSWAMSRLRVSLLPEGILQRYAGERVNSINSKVSEKLEAELAAQSFKADAEKVLKAIESYTAPAPTAEELEEGNVFPGFRVHEDDQFFT